MLAENSFHVAWCAGVGRRVYGDEFWRQLQQQLRGSDIDSAPEYVTGRWT